MGKLTTRIKSSKIMNKGVIKKVKDKIYFKFISPREEKKTDKYRVELIKVVGEICKDVHWQLMSGSFLKFYRDNTMDGQDLDFFVGRNDWDKVKDGFLKNKFLIKQVFFNENNEITEYKYEYKGCDVDVFIVDKDKKGYSHRFVLENIDSKDIKKKIFGNTLMITGKDYVSYERRLPTFKDATDYEYKGVKFRGPKDPEKYFLDSYGEGWRTPAKNEPRNGPTNNMPILHENAVSYLFEKALKNYDEMFKDIKS